MLLLAWDRYCLFTKLTKMKFSIHSTPELYQFFKTYYTATSVETGQYKVLLESLSVFDRPFGDEILERLSEKLYTERVVAQIVCNLYGMGTLAGKVFGQVYKDEFKKVAQAVETIPTAPSRERGKYLSLDEADEYFDSIKNPVGRAIQCLAYDAGLTPNDLLRELNGLRYLHEGLAVIGERFNKTNNAPRTIHFDPSRLNRLDPERELIGVVQMVTENTTADNAGLKGEVLGNYYHGSGYTIADLRNCHAFHLELMGYSQKEVGEMQGVLDLGHRLRNWKRKAGLK